MHSSGRGEESPEAYRGVVLPPAQQQPSPYGEQVRPAGGTPWGAPAQTPPAGPPRPEPADATQILPPYPAATSAPGGPVPVPDATQMLPPYPGGAPAGPLPGPQQAAAQGHVPPLPPVPPQAPPRADRQPVPPEIPDATRALPLSIFQEQQQSYEPSYEPPAYEPPPAFEPPPAAYQQPSYPQQPSYDQAYPQQFGQGPGQGHGQGRGQGQEYGGHEQPQQPGPEHDSDYDHLFRSDVPSPPPLRQRIIQPPSQQQPAPQPVPQQPGQQPYGQGAGQPPHGGQQGYEAGYVYDDGSGRGGGGRKLSPKVLIGIVVAGCVVAGLVVGGLLNSGGSADADNTGGKNTLPSATTSSSASGAAADAGASGGDDAAEKQAQALDSLLKTSGNSRSSVVNAVESIKNCENLAAAASDLRAAATQRIGQVTRLGTLSVDKLPGHADLTAALTKAWQASAAADSHYASWADEARSDHKVCKGDHARVTGESQAANRESGTATQQKKRAVRLWNAIAGTYGLTTRQYSQL